MPFITIDLLRRRSEHNEGCLSDLKEIALHQQDLERITVIGDVCRQIEIIYMCNNYIPRIENLIHCKMLKYLNLAINNIKVVEGLESCEMLEKLDLTLNFISEYESVRKLRANTHLKILHLTGNPCCDIANYRLFVIEQLPQLSDLDGTEIVRSELIAARQDEEQTTEAAKAETVKTREQQRIHDEMRAKGIDPYPARFNEKGERVYGHSAEERVQMLRETQEEERQRNEEKNKPRPGSISALKEEMDQKPAVITVEQELEKYGRILLRNEAKLPFTIDECKIPYAMSEAEKQAAAKQNATRGGAAVVATSKAALGGAALSERKQEQQQGAAASSSTSTSTAAIIKQPPKEEDGVVVTVQPGRYISTASIDIDLQTTHVRITIKGKILQLVFPVEVAPDRARVQRSQTTGELKLSVPVAAHIQQERETKKRRF